MPPSNRPERRARLVFAVGLAFALAGCANQSNPDKLPPPQALVRPPAMDSGNGVAVADYTCANGTKFHVTFDDLSNTATISGVGATSISLPQRITADGFDYGNGDYDLRGKGDEAMWKVSEKPAVKCSAKPQ